MEVPGLVCRAGEQWIVQRDDGTVYISTRTLSSALRFSQSQSLCHSLTKNGAMLVDRRSFPDMWLCLPKEEKAHFFVRLALLSVQLKRKYVSTICDIQACVEAELGRLHNMCRAELAQFKLPHRREELAVAPSMPKRPRVATIVDVDVAAQGHVYEPRTPTVIRLPTAATTTQPLRRVSFVEFDFGTPLRGPLSPAFVCSKGPTSGSDRQLRSSGEIGLAQQLLEMERRPPPRRIIGEGIVFVGGDDERNIVEGMHRKVLREMGVAFQGDNPVPLPITLDVRLDPIRSERHIDEIKRVAEHLGHGVEHIGASNSRYGLFGWKLTLNTKGHNPSQQNALHYFGLDLIVFFGSTYKSDRRRWIFESDCLDRDALLALATSLLFGALPDPPVHADFANDACGAWRHAHPWLCQSGTSLGTDAPPASFLTGENAVAFATVAGLKRLLAVRCCKQPKVSIDFLSTSGIAATAHVICRCETSSTVFLGAEDSTYFNRAAFVASQMSGRPAAVERFLSLLGLSGNIVNRDAKGSLRRELALAANVVFEQARSIILQYATLANVGVLSADLVHKRMAKRQTMGEAYSTCLTTGDPRLGKVINIFVTDRRIAQEQLRNNKVIEMPSPIADGPVLRSTLGGVEHYTFELGIQATKQLLEASLSGREGAHLPAVPWKLEKIITDSLSSAPNSVRRVFGDDSVQVMSDFWHKRNAFRKAIKNVKKQRTADKEPKFPQFQRLDETLPLIFSDSLFDKKSKDEFIAIVEQHVVASSIQVRCDEKHTKAWDSLLKKAGKMYDKITVEMNTSINELFHAHLRFFCIKGDPMSPRHWETLLKFAYLSYNNYPSWQLEVLKQFLKKV